MGVMLHWNVAPLYQESHENRMNTQTIRNTGKTIKHGLEPHQPYVSGPVALSVAPMMDGRYRV